MKISAAYSELSCLGLLKFSRFDEHPTKVLTLLSKKIIKFS